jgi:hypothetical protein
MAQTPEEIYNNIVTTYVAECNTAGVEVEAPSTWRQVSRRRLFANAVAFVIWLLQKLFDQQRIDVDETIAAKNPGTPRWYVEMAKKFQYGYILLPGSDQYDPRYAPDISVEDSKIIKFAAFVEEPFIRLKVAKLNGTSLAKLSDDELDAFKEYIKQIKYAGVKLKDSTITSGDPDKLKLSMRVKVNPLTINAQGQRINSTDLTPVPDAVRGYLQNIDFNGTFSRQKLERAVLDVSGVDDLAIDELMTQYALLPFRSVDIDFVPDSGYLVIENVDLSITYILN